MTSLQGVRTIYSVLLCALLCSCVISYGPYFKNETDTDAYISFVATRADTLLDWPAWELSPGFRVASLLADPRAPIDVISLTIRYGDKDSISFSQQQLEELYSNVGGARYAAFIISPDGVSVISEDEMFEREREKQ